MNNTPSDPETILVVDDRQPVCELIEVIFIRVGYRVLTARRPADALQLARETPRIDLLLTDLEMPGMRGDELAMRFTSLHPTAAVIFISGVTGPICASRPYAFLRKPFSVASIRDTVRQALLSRIPRAEFSRAA
jgi:CheY-like chemotaxis protein